MRYLIVLEYYYCVDYNCYMDYDYYASSSRLPLGEELWASAVDAHLFFVPFPTERLMNGIPSPV